MSNRMGDFICGVLVGVPVTLTLIYVLWWFSTYQLSLTDQYFIIGFLGGAGIVECLHRIDWSVGF